MDAAELAASAAVGAAAAIATAALIARAGERGRAQEGARQRLLANVRLFRSQVAMERGSDFRPATDPDYLGGRERKRFAEKVEADLLGASRLLAWRVRKRLERLTGPLDARTARWSAPLPVTDRDTKSQVVFFLERVADEGLSDDEVNDHGLLGAAEEARPTPGAKVALDAVVAELRSLERVIVRWRW